MNFKEQEYKKKNINKNICNRAKIIAIKTKI